MRRVPCVSGVPRGPFFVLGETRETDPRESGMRYHLSNAIGPCNPDQLTAWIQVRSVLEGRAYGQPTNGNTMMRPRPRRTVSPSVGYALDERLEVRCKSLGFLPVKEMPGAAIDQEA